MKQKPKIREINQLKACEKLINLKFFILNFLIENFRFRDYVFLVNNSLHNINVKTLQLIKIHNHKLPFIPLIFLFLRLSILMVCLECH